jgi:hypothetical protein
MSTIVLNPVPILSNSLITEFDQHTFTPTSYTFQLYVVPANGIVFLQEDPLQESPSIPTGVTVTETAGTNTGTMVEVLTSPGPGQFQVNYFNGSVQFSTAVGGDVGATVAISYLGIGSVVLAETINNMNSYLIPAYNFAATINPSNDLTNFTFTNVTVTGTLIAEVKDVEAVLSTDPVSPVVGQIWFNTTDSQFKGWNGSAVVILG